MEPLAIPEPENITPGIMRLTEAQGGIPPTSGWSGYIHIHPYYASRPLEDLVSLPSPGVAQRAMGRLPVDSRPGARKRFLLRVYHR
jgi:hypothetical protein